MRGPREKVPREKLGELTVPVLVAVGSKDVIGGSGAALAELIPNAQFLDIVGRDHMKAVGDKQFKQGVLAFLHSRP
jgi:pimeloyl-ACP methyl ester carboxylesterase